MSTLSILFLYCEMLFGLKFEQNISKKIIKFYLYLRAEGQVCNREIKYPKQWPFNPFIN
jgi:hypothetical protein